VREDSLVANKERKWAGLAGRVLSFADWMHHSTVETGPIGGALVVEQDVAFNPLNVCFFRVDGIVFAADGIADLGEEFFWGLGLCHSTVCFRLTFVTSCYILCRV